MKTTVILFLVITFFMVSSPAALAEITYEGRDTGSVEYGDAAGLEGVPYYPSSMARLDLGAYRNGLVYTGNALNVRFFAPSKMYVNILDFSPDGNATLLLYNHYTAPGSNVLDWYVEGTVQGDPGREYLYMIVSTEALSYEYLESVASNPREYEPEEHIYATDIESFQVVPGTGVRTGMPAYNPFVEIQGTPLEVYPTYYIFPRDDRYRNPYFYYYYYVPGGRQGGGKYYRSRVGIGGKNYYAYPQGGISFGNLTGLHTTGHIIDDRWRVIPGTFLSGTFRLGTVPNPIGMVLHPYMPGGFYRSYEDWGNELTFDVWLNNEKQVQGYVVNEEYGNPVIFVPVEGANLVDGENKFEIRVPIEGQTVDIERIEIVESDLPEEVDTGAPN